MGFPSEGLEAAYRNDMTQVQAFFNSRHPKSYRVYNLCSERQYDASKFHQAVRYPFDDHNSPPFEVIHQLCQDASSFLGGFAQFDPLAGLPGADGAITVPLPKKTPAGDVVLPTVTPVIAIHCKAGKGRTGLMVACLLLHEGY